MKRIQFTLLTIVLAITSSITFAQEIAGAEITFEKEVYDYGKIQQHSDGGCSFIFTNTGSAPLTIKKAIGSCGCTVPDWPRKPIAPGESAEILVMYKTAKVGLINRSVTITSNAINAPNAVIRVHGEVLANNSISVEKPASAPVKK